MSRLYFILYILFVSAQNNIDNYDVTDLLRLLCYFRRYPMEKDRSIKITPEGQRPANAYDDGNIPQVDLPQDVTPEQVPRKDGPGGESGE